MDDSASKKPYGYPELRTLVGPVVRFATILLVVSILDVLASLLLSTILPDSFYLNRYLHDSFEQTTQEFLAGEARLLPDRKTGWVNKPGQMSGGSFVEEDGSRRSTRFEQGDSADLPTVLFLGSSLIHGGFGVSDAETIGSYLAETGVTSKNHGTMMYSVDQSLLFLRHHVPVSPDVIVLGIEDNVTAMDNMFIPFRERQQENMPFLKPRLQLIDGQTRVTEPELDRQRSVYSMVEYLETLRDLDGSHHSYARFKRLGMLPISRSILYFWNRVSIVFPDPAKYHMRLELQKNALKEIHQLALKAEAQLIVVRFSAPLTLKRKILNLLVEDPRDSHESSIRSVGLPLIDVRGVLQSNGEPLNFMYAADGLHLTARANEIVAAEIERELFSAPAIAQDEY